MGCSFYTEKTGFGNFLHGFSWSWQCGIDGTNRGDHVLSPRKTRGYVVDQNLGASIWSER